MRRLKPSTTPKPAKRGEQKLAMKPYDFLRDAEIPEGVDWLTVSSQPIDRELFDWDYDSEES